MRSMTGFGRNETEMGNHKLNIEVKSVNHRFLDINIRMPRYLLFLEEEVRKTIKSRLERGRVDVFVNYTDLGNGGKTCRADVSLAKAYLQAIAQIEEQTQIPNDITMENLVRLPDVIVFEESEKNEEELRELLKTALNAALDQLVVAREVEGKRISRDIFERLELLETKVADIEEKADVVVEEYREKLRQRISEFLENTELDETRFQQEILYFADRCNITEEIVRLKSHLKQCTKTLLGDAPSGRNMDFIIQELNREFNTIGSKASDLEITKAVLFAKGEVEKIREQIQNIE